MPRSQYVRSPITSGVVQQRSAALIEIADDEGNRRVGGTLIASGDMTLVVLGATRRSGRRPLEFEIMWMVGDTAAQTAIARLQTVNLKAHETRFGRANG